MVLEKLKQKIFARTTAKRTFFFLLGDVAFIILACWLSFLLRFDGKIPVQYIPMIKGFIELTIPLIIFFFWLEKLYAISWSFVSISELFKLGRAVIISFLLIGTTIYILKIFPLFEGFPRSIIFITAFLTFFLTGGLRFSKRIYLQEFQRSAPRLRPVLIVGSDDAAEQLVRHIITSKDSPYAIVGLIDDNLMKQGVLIHGKKVLGKRIDIPKIVKKHEIKELIIASPSAPQEIIRETVKLAREAGIQKIKILPGTREILAEKVSLNQLRDVSIEDLLGREAIKIDTQAIQNFISGKTILVTGAAGSIGSHLCQEILKFNPARLIAFDQNETGLFHLGRNLNKEFPNIAKSFEIGDICDEKKINWLFETEKPNVIFHAAAYKHVPVMESHPLEAIKNNVFGTLTLAQAATKHGVDKFVLISTDKAVNPTSVMGATKQVGEMICLWLNKKNLTKFCAVRFGNVLDSQGNVVGIFEEQIKKGGPVEVTHPEMKRYFMVTSEACLLVMQAGALGQGGEVFVLDMGQPIKIVDLAKEMIRLAGYESDVDIPIVFTQMRPGEKLFEEILTNSEIPTKHEKIFMAKLSNFDEQKIIRGLEKFKQALDKMDKNSIIKILKEIIPTYK
ncbi:MAG: nucleoside-diphosphate sugar epimerase/dehydratase [Patescibacteria group bacterium]|nr:nucleoside-diphosphate sugar epimerase/dehydratase [Patescibacteria group bacterium]MDD5164192.1 nucleoside-diphosphate sugar epimerase/dehydratase [Patescibacteria group bacterium]MDD5534474.1 nucleoside-diphosphate sugar epimerase/dehydratase [Patescibacteria group bacterium]